MPEKTEDQLTEVRGELATERRERTDADVDVTRKLENVAVGGLYLEVIGLGWLLAATIATSVPDGVAWLLHSLFAYL